MLVVTMQYLIERIEVRGVIRRYIKNDLLCPQEKVNGFSYEAAWLSSHSLLFLQALHA